MFQELSKCLGYSLLSAFAVSILVLFSIIGDLGQNVIGVRHYIIWFIGATIVLTPVSFLVKHLAHPKDYFSWSNTLGGALGLVLYVHWALIHWWGPVPLGLGNILSIEEISFDMIDQMIKWQVLFLALALAAKNIVRAAWNAVSS